MTKARSLPGTYEPLEREPEIAAAKAIAEIREQLRHPRDTFTILQFGFILTLDREGSTIVVNVSKALLLKATNFGVKPGSDWTGTVFEYEGGDKIETIAAFRSLTESLAVARGK